MSCTGGVNFNGAQFATSITALPVNGILYQAVFALDIYSTELFDATQLTAVAAGDLVIDSTGVVFYRPLQYQCNDTGVFDAFEYQWSDAGQDSVTAQVYINVRCLNDPPTGVAQTITIAPDKRNTVRTSDCVRAC